MNDYIISVRELTKCFGDFTAVNPIIIILRMASIYHRAGTIYGRGLNTVGRFSIGNTIPESIIIGSSITIADMSSATTCEETSVDTSNPNARARIK